MQMNGLALSLWLSGFSVPAAQLCVLLAWIVLAWLYVDLKEGK